MTKVADVKFFQGDVEIPCGVLVEAVFSHMLRPMDEGQDHLKIYAAGTKAGYLFLDLVSKQFPEIRSLLHFQPEVANHFATMFVGGMLMKKALDSKENDISIEIDLIEEDDKEDVPSPCNCSCDKESSTDSTANSSGCVHDGASEDEGRTTKESLE